MMEINSPTFNNVTQEQFWQEQIKLKQASGLSRAAYCREHNLICSKFAYWEHKLSKPRTKLLPVKLNQAAVQQAALCTLVFRSGNELKIYDSITLPVILSTLG